MERCANTEALNKYQEKLAKQSKAYERFIDEIDDDLLELQEIIAKLKKKASDYDGYDFADELKELVNDTIWNRNMCIYGILCLFGCDI